MAATVKLIAVGLFWALALFGALSMHTLPGDWGGHVICGPWGCGPSLQALLGFHSFWIVLISLPVGLAIWKCSADLLRFMGRLSAGMSLTGIVLIVGWVATASLLNTPTGQPTYFIQRVLFRLAIFVDAPILPLGLCGVILLLAARSKLCQQLRLQEEPLSTEAAEVEDL